MTDGPRRAWMGKLDETVRYLARHWSLAGMFCGGPPVGCSGRDRSNLCTVAKKLLRVLRVASRGSILRQWTEIGAPS